MIKNTKTRIKWFSTVEKNNSIDNYCRYVYSVKQPSIEYLPVNKKYFKQKSRFL